MQTPVTVRPIFGVLHDPSTWLQLVVVLVEVLLMVAAVEAAAATEIGGLTWVMDTDGA